MTDQHEFAGKTIEEALELAAKELAAKADSIEYKLLETPKRFFFMGGSKEYRIRVLKYTPSAAGAAPVMTPSPRSAQPAASHHDRPPQPARPDRPPQPARPDRPPQPARPDRPSQPARTDRPPQPARPDRPSQPARTDRPPQPARTDRPPQPARPDRPSQPARPDRPPQPARTDRPPQPARPDRPSQPARPDRPSQPVIDAPGPAWSTVQEPAPWQPVRREESEARGGDDEELDRILDLVEEFLDSWGMDLEMDVRTSDERLEIDFFGEDQQYLLEKKGEGLLSLQLILGKMLYKRGLIRRKLQVDCQGYRQGREKELREIANRTADRVKKNGEDALLNPMNPYERRIIHLTLADDQQVTTDSLGDGYMKKIRIFRT